VQGIPDAEVSAGDRENGNVVPFVTDGAIPSLEEAERQLIERALEQFGGNRRKAAEALGISERTLYRKIEQYGV
jgi:DNA-binding NtrC family response regulator